MASSLIGQHQITTFTTPVNGTSPIDANQVRGNDNTIKTAYDAHDNSAILHFQDSTAAARPVAGTVGRKWLDNDTYRVYYDDGANWQEIAYAALAGAAFTGPVTITSTTAPQLSIRYDGSNKLDVSVSSAGAVTFNATGASAGFSFSDLITAAAGATITSGQTLTVTGATITGLTAASVGAGTFPAGAFVFAGAVSGITTLATSSTINSQTISAAANFTGSVTAIGPVIVKTAAQTNPIRLTSFSDATTYGLITLNNTDTAAGALGMAGGGGADTVLYFQGQTGGFQWNIANVSKATMSNAGLLTLAGGLTVSAGTTAVQALTATTGTFAGNILPSATATYDVGVTGTRWRDAFFSRNVNIGDTVTTTGLVISGLSATAVSAGAADSGGAGFKLLRVPN